MNRAFRYRLRKISYIEDTTLDPKDILTFEFKNLLDFYTLNAANVYKVFFIKAIRFLH